MASPSGTRRRDPLGIHTALPLTGRFYPLGFPLEIATNSRDAIEAAGEAWPGVAEFDTPPLVMRVLAQAKGPLSRVPTHRQQGHLYSVISDRYNFAHADLDSQFAFIQVSQMTASDHSWLRWFFLECVAYVMLAQRHVVMAHAGCVARNGSGVLLCGPSAAGKSTLSFAAARAGWTWISDDCVCLLPDSPARIALGRSREARFRLDAPLLFPELEGYVARARPTGKIGIEVAMAGIPGVDVAARAPVGALAFLDRRPGGPSIERVSGEEAVERVLAEMPCYGGDTDLLHERTVRRLAEAPAYRLSYETLQDGVRLLSDL